MAKTMARKEATSAGRPRRSRRQRARLRRCMLAVVAVGGITSALAGALPHFMGGHHSTQDNDSQGWAGYFATQQPVQAGRRNPTSEVRTEPLAIENLTRSGAADEEALGTVAASAWQDDGLPSLNEWINLPKNARFPGAIVVLPKNVRLGTIVVLRDSALAHANSTLQGVGETLGYGDTTAHDTGGSARPSTSGNSRNASARSTSAGSGSSGAHGGSPTLASSGSSSSASSPPSGAAVESGASESASGSANDNPTAGPSVAGNSTNGGEGSTDNFKTTAPSSNDDTDTPVVLADSASSDNLNNDAGANGSGSGNDPSASASAPTNTRGGAGSDDDGPSAAPGETITGNDNGPKGPLIVDGELDGTATIDGDVIVLADGTLSPGHSPGDRLINGNLLNDGLLLIELEGENVGEFDRLFVTGEVSANAALVEFAFQAGFVPKAGDVFSFLFANSDLNDLFVNGEFDPQQIDFFSTGLPSELIADVVLVDGHFTMNPIGHSGPEQFLQRLDLVIVEVSEPVPFGLFAIGGLMLAFSRRITRR
jgi:hypothetical protein